jgi:DedD protein
MDDHQDSRQFRLGDRHLALLFIGAVAVCAVFFALGFVVGRGQTYEVAVKEQSSPGKTVDLKSLAGSSHASLEESPETARGPETDSLPPKAQPSRDKEADYGRELDFYNSLDRKNVDENFHPERPNAAKNVTLAERAKSKPVAPSSPTLKVQPESLVSLQVGAFTNATDADKLAKLLRLKGYSISLLSPANGNSDKLFRVQVGPFTHLEEANKVKTQLQKDGYEAILKR